MKRLGLFIFCVVSLPVLAATNAPDPKLAGIVNLPDFKYALIQHKSPTWRGSDWFVLGELQRDSGLEVLKIDANSERVEVRCDGTAATLSLNAEVETIGTHHRTGTFHIHFERVEFQTVLYLYAHLKKRTLLRHPSIRSGPISWMANPETQEAAITDIETMLNNRGFATIPDGEKFMMIVPESLTNGVSPRADKITAASANTTGAQAEELIAAGMVDFRQTPLVQVAQVYVDFVGAKKMEGRESAPFGFVTLTTVTPLTRAEVAYAMETMFEWNKVKMVPVEGGGLKMEQLK